MPGPLIAMVIAGGIVGIFDLGCGRGRRDRNDPRESAAISFAGCRGRRTFGRLVPGDLTIAAPGPRGGGLDRQAIAGQTRQRRQPEPGIRRAGAGEHAAAFFSGFPGSGSFTRSALNFRSGGRTPLSGVVPAWRSRSRLLAAAPLAAESAGRGAGRCPDGGGLRNGPLRGHPPHGLARPATTRPCLASPSCHAFARTSNLRSTSGTLISIGLHLAATSHPRIFRPCRT